jgi:hypothetical protein
MYKILLTALFLLILIFIIFYSFSNTARGERLPKNGESREQRVTFIEDLGYALDENFLEESKEVEIPYVFSDIYEEYNALHREAGYNLEKYRGKKVKQYTYKLADKNRKDLYAHLLIFEGSIIGGDIAAIDFKDGFMLPLKNNNT